LTQIIKIFVDPSAAAIDPNFEGNTCVVLLGVDREAVDRELGITENRRFLDMRLLDLHLDDQVGAESFPRLFARIMLKLQSVLEAVQPHRQWILEDGTIPSAAAVVWGVCSTYLSACWMCRESGTETKIADKGPGRREARGIETMGRFQPQEPVPESEGDRDMMIIGFY